MKKEEKRQRFHDALLQMLYPPPQQKEENHESIDKLSQGLILDRFPDESEETGSTSSSDGDKVECEDRTNKKLTRAQRKRLRKTKLKDAASCRRKIIGPMLPGSEDDCRAVENEPQGVRKNAADISDAPTDEPESGKGPSCSKQNKQKQRRMAKKLASERLKSLRHSK